MPGCEPRPTAPPRLPLSQPPLTSPFLSRPPLTSPFLSRPFRTSPPLTSPPLTSPFLTSPPLTSLFLTSPCLTRRPTRPRQGVSDPATRRTPAAGSPELPRPLGPLARLGPLGPLARLAPPGPSARPGPPVRPGPPGPPEVPDLAVVGQSTHPGSRPTRPR